MSAHSSGSAPDSGQDDDFENLDDPALDDLGDLGGEDPSGKPASDPEEARREAEDALARIEAMADLNADPEAEPSEAEPSTDEGASSETAASSPPSTEAADPPPDDATETTASNAPTPAEGADPHTSEGQCENCGALLHGPYCSQCGQKAADRIVPLWHMLNEVLEAVVELDLRVLHTLPKFFFLPGRLTKEYLNGRRKRYIRPLRLYLFATFLLFAVLALTTTGNFGIVLDPQGMTRLNPPNTGINLTGPGDTTKTAPQSSSFFGPQDQRERIARRLESDSVDIRLDLYDDPQANERLSRLLEARTAQAVRQPWNFVGSMIDRGPYLMFLMLPIFAFLLKLLYVRRKRYYVEHLIFSLHVHALAFFAFAIGLLLQQAEGGWLHALAPWIEAAPLLYLVLALSHVYEQGLVKSTLKALLLLLIYTVVLAVGFVLLMVAAVLLM